MFSDVLLLHPLGTRTNGVHSPNRTVAGGIREALCALAGHSFLLQTEPGRVFLRCAECGHETPGWTVAERAAHPRR
jgi:hypothetical protein